ncbi:PE38 [Choristoneura rosaceana nucleopolyhedrovirus]|uniref:PE38 n=1 Tax=Choristoneura rosaceana nucleopolyhedrovirus TaxID=58094 RepID=S5N9Y4_9ABAC|nr:PE38 [Choristoneura rosaceana nucleopolyhedrovirus]AGR57042.1 PE38 [Choristoneura rosaceana nucleopolyhedrovirus]
MYRRFSPYHRHTIYNNAERQRVQERLLTTLSEQPVTPVSATCSVCYETYVMQSNNIVEFMMPANCTHMFCFKCVLGMYNNAENIPRATVRCPMCQETATTWQSFFPNSVVSCKFIKKTADRVPYCQQFSDAMGILKKRYAALPEDISNNAAELREQLNRAQEEKTAELQRLKDAHDAKWNSSCRQISSLQKRVHELIELDDEFKNKIKSLERKNESLERKNESLQRQNNEYDIAIINNHKDYHRLKRQTEELEKAVSERLAEVRAANTKICCLEEKDRVSAKTIADLTQTVERLKSERASTSAVTVEFNNRNTDAALHQRFNSLLNSTFENMMLNERIITLQKEVFGSSSVPCHVNIGIKYNNNNNNNDDDDVILIEKIHDTITIDD